MKLLRNVLSGVGVLLVAVGVLGFALVVVLGLDAILNRVQGIGTDTFIVLGIHAGAMAFQIGCIGLVVLQQRFPRRWLTLVTRLAGATGIVAGIALAWSFVTDTFFGTRQSPLDLGDMLIAAVIFGGLLFGSLPAALARMPVSADTVAAR